MIKIIPSVRGQDAQGAGHFGASRGSRKHKGVDYACHPKSKILSVCEGEITKIGYPYNPKDLIKGHLRYVQVTDCNGFDVRYFYINPSVKKGDKVGVDGVLGESQDLRPIYKGITPHFHFEVKKDGAVINPNNYLRDLRR